MASVGVFVEGIRVMLTGLQNDITAALYCHFSDLRSASYHVLAVNFNIINLLTQSREDKFSYTDSYKTLRQILLILCLVSFILLTAVCLKHDNSSGIFPQ